MIRRDTVREIDWVEVFPWLCLVRALVVALDPRKIALALLGVLLTWVGWSTADRIHLAYRPNEPTVASRNLRIVDKNPWQQRPFTSSAPDDEATLVVRLKSASGELVDTVGSVVHWYSWPFWRLFSTDSSWWDVLIAAACAVWTLAVWAFCGGAITRLAAVRLTQDRRLGWRQAMRHAVVRWPAYFCSPLFSLGGVLVLFLIPAALSGLIARADWGFAAVGFLWPLGMALAAIATFLLVMLLLGWPLMWCTISTEGSDAFDSFGRSVSYVSQRPFHYAFYIVVAAVLGTAGWFAIAMLGEMTIELTKWGVTWGSGNARAEAIFSPGKSEPLLGTTWVAYWDGTLRLLVYCFGHSFFWCAASGIYLLLRRDTDATPLDDVHLDIEEDPYALPRVRRDEAGVTVLDEKKEPVS